MKKEQQYVYQMEIPLGSASKWLCSRSRDRRAARNGTWVRIYY